MLVIVFLVSLIPAVVLYFWMKNRVKDDPEYRNTCRKALIKGLQSTLITVPMSFALNLLAAAVIKDHQSLLYVFVYNFFVLAFSEEFSKMFMMLKLKKKSRPWSWMETTVFMTVTGIGFELPESLVYGFMTNAIQMLVRGATMMHAVFGMIMGYFYGKAEYTGKKIYYVLSFVLPWLMHGAYDFSLQDQAGRLNDFLLFLPLIIVIINMAVLFGTVRFMRRERNSAKYTAAAGQ